MSELHLNICKLISEKFFISGLYNIYAPMPSFYLNIPNIYHLLPNEYVKFDINLILDYFEYIFKSDQSNIKLINDVICGEQIYGCDYCMQKIDISDIYFHCLMCRTDVCSNCRLNSSSNEFNQSKELKNCLNNHNLISRSTYKSIKCTYCLTNIYANMAYVSTSNYYNSNVCLECANINGGLDYISSLNLSLKQIPSIYDQTGFGSILDWIPLITDNENNLILINLNPTSLNCNKLALSCIDDLGNRGYYQISKSQTLNELLDELLHNISTYNDNIKPIKRIMLNNKMNINFE